MGGRLAGLLLLGLVAVLGTVGGAKLLSVLGDDGSEGQAMAIPAGGPNATGPWVRPGRWVPGNGEDEGRTAAPSYLTQVDRTGRYFRDQYGEPVLVKGDSPWAMMTRLSPAQAELWFENREAHGFNAAIVSLVGATVNGAPHDDGSTFDGIAPFVDGDILQWNEPYWRRVTDYLRMAADHGITVMLFPIDGWTIGHAVVPDSIEECYKYGRKVADRFRSLPNIVWMSGGDYVPASSQRTRGTDVDHCLDAMMRGVRATGDRRPFSLELWPPSFSTQNPYWASRVDWNFVYTYNPTYRAVLEAYQRSPAIPAVLGEANYEGENNIPDTPPTTDETLRRQVLWALTSGAAGDFFGSDDWEFHDGWEERLTTPAVEQVSRLRGLFETLPWWRLVPDSERHLVRGGTGRQLSMNESVDVLDDDHVTAASTPDGRVAVVYMPTHGTVSIDRHAVARGSRALWIDPVSGDSHRAPMSSSFTSPGRNSGGDEDWLLLLEP